MMSAVSQSGEFDVFRKIRFSACECTAKSNCGEQRHQSIRLRGVNSCSEILKILTRRHPIPFRRVEIQFLLSKR